LLPIQKMDASSVNYGKYMPASKTRTTVSAEVTPASLDHPFSAAMLIRDKLDSRHDVDVVILVVVRNLKLNLQQSHPRRLSATILFMIRIAELFFFVSPTFGSSASRTVKNAIPATTSGIQS